MSGGNGAKPSAERELEAAAVSSNGSGSAERIGFYICHCGINIAFRVRCAEVAREIGTLPDVVVSRDYLFMCSDPGQDLIIDDVRKLGLTRVVVASCSPRMHENTFRQACVRAGLNPFRAFHHVCVREHVSWVTPDEDEATEKAKVLCRAGVLRVAQQSDLTPKRFKVNPSSLVVGGGISGMQASLDLAKAGYKVHLVERSPTIGGHMLQYDKTFPTLDCAACIGTPKMVSVGQSPEIELHTHSEVKEVSGFIGNFKVKVLERARYVDASKCTGCGDCQNNCPVPYRPSFDRPAPKLEIEAERETLARKAIDRYADEPGRLLPIMIDINSELGWLPRDVMRYIAAKLEVPVSEVLRVATFYNFFSLVPRGRHTISVCMGTGCFVKGADAILSSMRRRLKIEAGQTTEDRRFSLEVVRCLGCCALAPVVRIGEDVYGGVDPDKMEKFLKRYE